MSLQNGATGSAAGLEYLRTRSHQRNQRTKTIVIIMFLKRDQRLLTFRSIIIIIRCARIRIKRVLKLLSFRCGRGHFASQCNLSRDIRCSGCGGSGHLVKVCFKKKENANNLEEVLQLEHTDQRNKFFVPFEKHSTSLRKTSYIRKNSASLQEAYFQRFSPKGFNSKKLEAPPTPLAPRALSPEKEDMAEISQETTRYANGFFHDQKGKIQHVNF